MHRKKSAPKSDHSFPYAQKNPDDAVNIAVAEGGAMVGEMCVWWVVAVGEKMADGDERTVFIHRWAWLLCVEKWWKKKSQCIWGHAVAEVEFAAGEMCTSLKAAMGMLATDGDKLAMMTLFDRMHDESKHD